MLGQDSLKSVLTLGTQSVHLLQVVPVLLQLSPLVRAARQLGDLELLVEIAVETEPVSGVTLLLLLLSDKSPGSFPGGLCGQFSSKFIDQASA